MFGVVPKALWERRFPADAENRVRLARQLPARPRPGVHGPRRDRPRRPPGTRSRASATRSRRPRTFAPGSPGPASGRRGRRARAVAPALRPRRRGDAPRRRREPCRPSRTRPLYVQARRARARARPNERDRASYVRRTGSRTRRPAGSRPSRASARSAPACGRAAARPQRRHAGDPDRVGREDRFYFADALPTSAHVPIPWIMAYDLYPVELIQNKKRLLDDAVREGWLCVFEHDPDVPWGTIVDEANGKRRVHVVPGTRPSS